MEKVTIGSALRRVKKLKGEVDSASRLAASSVVFIKTAPPAYEFSELVKTREVAVRRMLALQSAIAVSNATHTLPNGMLVAYAVRRLQELKGELAFYQGLAVKVNSETSETTKSHEYRDVGPGEDIKRVTVEVVTVTISKLTERGRMTTIARLQAAFDAVNDLLEAHNHKTLIEVNFDLDEKD